MNILQIKNYGWYDHEVMLFTGTPSTGEHVFRAVILSGRLKSYKLDFPEGSAQ